MADDPQVTLVLGGARSGKSAFAEQLAGRSHGAVLFVATGVACDAEMAERIAAHRAARPASWRSVEAPTNVGAAIREDPVEANVVLVDCLSFLVSNCLLDLDSESDGNLTEQGAWPRIVGEVQGILSAAGSRGASLIVVSNEVGMAVVPEHRLGRVYRDLLGRANQELARRAEVVYLMVAGIPVDVKALARITAPPIAS